jgi:hypothetical protein
VTIKRDNWRRTWKKVPAENRRVAAGSLRESLGPGRRAAWLLAAMLGGSLVLHATVVPFVVESGDTEAMSASKGAYLRKVMQKEQAKAVSKAIKGKITMPPPPPDPEAVVEGAFRESLSGDVEKLISGGKGLDKLSTEVVARLAKNVAASLQNDLETMSAAIVAGKMSPEEIKKKHDALKEKAHALTRGELEKYRVETQLERAEMSTTEWYEKQMSPTLLGNINYALLVRRTHYAGLWWHVFCGRYTGWTRYRNWSGMGSNRYLGGKISLLKRLKQGLLGPYGRAPHAAWPGPGKEQANVLEKRLHALYSGTARASHNSVTYPTPSWKSVIYGDTDRHNLTGSIYEVHLSDGILSEFWPHREDEKIKIAEALDDLWDKLLEDVKAYRVAAETQAPATRLTTMRDGCYKTMDTIGSESRKLLNPDARAMGELNTLIRINVMTGEMRDKMFKHWTDGMVTALERLIRRIANGQYEKGIIVHKAGVAEAKKEFEEKVVPMLRRDMMRMISARKFRRLIWANTPGDRGYKTPGGEGTNVPSDADAKKEAAKLAALLKARPDLKAYAGLRRATNEEHFEEAIDNTRDAILAQVQTGGLLLKQMHVFVEGVDYTDEVEEKLNSRLAAMKGRGQDLTSLTKDGLPDAQAPLVALFFGASKGHGTTLQPIETTMLAAHYRSSLPEFVLQSSTPYTPGGPKPLARGDVLPEQPKLKPAFKGRSPRFETIPFLYRFPKIDGDLTDWGEIRPLTLRGRGGTVLVYAAWAYQGFFFGYHVDLPEEEFYYPREARFRKGMSPYHRNRAVEWPFAGDHFRLLFDTLDARMPRRGEPHMQEFVVLPRGTDTMPGIPGMEREMPSSRDAERKQWRGVKSKPRTFPEQPQGKPDGSGPYRVTQVTKTGYTVEVFIPRTLFKTPVFSPGWHIGFDCAVAKGYQGQGSGKRGSLQFWASGDTAKPGNRGGNRPDTWGDLLLLGTDARFTVQDADAKGVGSLSQSVIPGHSYLLTVFDPDRNLSLSTVDEVLVSAEVADAAGSTSGKTDVEVFVLKEDGENTNQFRGYVNTQPGLGRQVAGVLEVQSGQQVVFGYVDLGDAKGNRNPKRYIRLPVVAPVLETGAKKRALR